MNSEIIVHELDLWHQIVSCLVNAPTGVDALSSAFKVVMLSRRYLAGKVEYLCLRNELFDGSCSLCSFAYYRNAAQ